MKSRNHRERKIFKKKYEIILFSTANESRSQGKNIKKYTANKK